MHFTIGLCLSYGASCSSLSTWSDRCTDAGLVDPGSVQTSPAIALLGQHGHLFGPVPAQLPARLVATGPTTMDHCEHVASSDSSCGAWWHRIRDWGPDTSQGRWATSSWTSTSGLGSITSALWWWLTSRIFTPAAWGSALQVEAESTTTRSSMPLSSSHWCAGGWAIWTWTLSELLHCGHAYNSSRPNH